MYSGEQVKDMVTNIMENLDDQGKIQNILNDFVTDYTDTLTQHETLTKDKESLIGLNENLRNVNNKMMSQIGDLSFLTKKEEEKQKEIEEQEKENELSFENLFNEKGELI